MRFASGFGTDAAFEAALAMLRAQGAVLVDIAEFPSRQEIGRNEFAVLLAELKHDLNAYLATLPAAVTDADAGRPDRLQPRPCRRGDGPVRPGFVRAVAGDRRARRGLAHRARDLAPAGRAEGIDRVLQRAQCRRPGRTDPAGGVADRRGPWRPEPGRRRGAGSPQWPAIRTSPYRWGRFAACRWG